MPSEPDAACLLLFGHRGHRGNHLAGHEAALTCDLIHDFEGLGDALWRVDDDRDHGEVTSHLQQLVAVGGVIPVETPDPA